MASDGWMQESIAGHEESGGLLPDSDFLARISDADIMSILSAREFPFPPAALGDSLEGMETQPLQQLSFGFTVADGVGGVHRFSGSDDLPAATNQQTSLANPQTQTRNTKKRPSNEQDTKERRKKQIRDAQRAYRLRKESRISFLTKRVAQLEKAVEGMSTTVVNFSDSLLQSGVLASHAQLTRRTRETLQKCLQAAQTSSSDEPWDQGSSPMSTSSGDTFSETPQPESNLPHQNMESFFPQRFPPPTSTAASEIQYSTFMDQLHLTVLYRAFTILSNPSISSNDVRRAFRFMYPSMGRGRIAAYFAAALHAKLSQQDFSSQWLHIPFFQLGGAGTHYAWPPEQGPYTRRSRQWTSVSVPISDFSKDIQERLVGDWFDLQDLECFLMERNVKLVSGSESFETSVPLQHSKSVNARKLTANLLLNAFCLGRSPGFRRSDVEMAISKAVLV